MMDLVQKAKHVAIYWKRKGLFTNKYEFIYE
jgi:hypothetical protein